MDNKIAITATDIHKSFKLPHDKTTSIKGAMVNFYRRKKTYEELQALKGVTFNVKRGEFFGIVGRNGSGKSTMLKLLAGIYVPTRGDIIVNGKLTPFIELGVGFSPELTGRENVFLNGALLGFSRRDMQSMYKDIVNFAEIANFMDQKLKNYSSGMQVRLAFSIAIRANPEILLLDEVLAVGDAAFQRKCYDYFMSLKKDKRTVVLVTHDMGAVRQYCDRAIMIEKGKIIKEGDPEKVAQAYQKLFNDEEAEKEDMPESKPSSDWMLNRWGEGTILANRPKVKVTEKELTLETSYVAQRDVAAPIYGFTIFGPGGNNIMENNTQRAKIKTKALDRDDVIKITWQIPNIFSSGRYSVSVACCDQSATRFYDWVDDAASFRVNKETNTTGAVDPDVQILDFETSKA